MTTKTKVTVKMDLTLPPLPWKNWHREKNLYKGVNKMDKEVIQRQVAKAKKVK